MLDRRPPALAAPGENRYIRGNLWFSYDRVLRVGPTGPALFYYLNEPGPNGASGAVWEPAGSRLRPGFNPCKQDPFDPGYDRSNCCFRGYRPARRAASRGRAGRG